jgi:hypothetical protein
LTRNEIRNELLNYVGALEINYKHKIEELDVVYRKEKNEREKLVEQENINVEPWL